MTLGFVAKEEEVEQATAALRRLEASEGEGGGVETGGWKKLR